MQMTSRQSIAVLLVLGMLCLGAVLAEIVNAGAFNFYCNDDAYISFTYAKNLVHGLGLEFNTGERVEGYTNFLWLMFLAPWIRLLPAVDVSHIAIFWGAVFSMVVVVLTFRLADADRTHRWVCLVAPLLLCLDNSFHYWSVSGLENALQATLVLAGFLFLFGSGRRSLELAGIFFGLATMTRPDSGLFWAVAAACLAARPGSATRFRDALRLTAGFLLPLVPYALWKLYYYGGLIPNTFYLHTGNRAARMQKGASYFVLFLQNRFWIPLLAGGALLAGVTFRRVVLLASIAAFCAYAVWIGGDFFPGSRYFYVVLPLLSLCIADAASALAARRGAAVAGAAVVLACVLVCAGSYGPAGEYRRFVLPWAEDDLQRIQFSQDLARVASPGEAILAGPIGQIGYYSGLRVLDYWGVIDPHIARLRTQDISKDAPGHEKSDLKYLMDRKPTYVVFGYDRSHPPAGYSSYEVKVEDRTWIVFKRNP